MSQTTHMAHINHRRRDCARQRSAQGFEPITILVKPIAKMSFGDPIDEDYFIFANIAQEQPELPDEEIF